MPHIVDISHGSWAASRTHSHRDRRSHIAIYDRGLLSPDGRTLEPGPTGTAQTAELVEQPFNRNTARLKRSENVPFKTRNRFLWQCFRAKESRPDGRASSERGQGCYSGVLKNEYIST